MPPTEPEEILKRLPHHQQHPGEVEVLPKMILLHPRVLGHPYVQPDADDHRVPHVPYRATQVDEVISFQDKRAVFGGHV